jgi:tetratricopeptide (TPR) repeat protein
LELGRVCLTLGRLDEAARAFRSAAALDKRSLDPYREMARLYDAVGYLDREVATLERLQTAAPSDVVTLVQLGHLYVQLAWQQRAGPVLTRAVKLAPDLPAAQYEMARYEWETAHSDAAVSRLTAFHQRHPDETPIVAKLAEYEMALQHFREAETLLSEALRRKPDAQDLQRLLAYNLIKQGDATRLQAALAILNPIVTRGTADAEPYCRLGQVYEQLRRYPDAVAAYEVAFRRDPAFENTALSLGRLYLREGKQQQGERLVRFYTAINANMQLYSQAHERLRHHFNDPNAHLEVAFLDVKTNRLPEAILEFRYVVTLRPKDTVAWKGLKRALLAANRRAEANAITVR